MSGITRFEIRDARGELQAIHVRRDGPDGKVMPWRLPGATRDGLGGRPVASLPLYRSETIAALGRAAVILIVEGEKAADALASIGMPALGTFGADTRPTIEAMSVVRGHAVILWPDNDQGGWDHAVAVGETARRAGATSVRIIAYRPTTEAGRWRKGFDAADLIAGCASPDVASLMIELLVEEWAERLLRPAPTPTRPVRTAPRRELGDTGSVSDALIARGSYTGTPGDPMPRPGRSVRCPMHDDRRASLSILRDDRRVVCHSPGCVWSGRASGGRGAIASDIRAARP